MARSKKPTVEDKKKSTRGVRQLRAPKTTSSSSVAPQPHNDNAEVEKSPPRKGMQVKGKKVLMREWLEKELNQKTAAGMRWEDRENGIFRVDWKHGSRQGWDRTVDSEVFQRWAIHTGKYKGMEKDSSKRWKATFRCAINSLEDVEEIVERSQKKGLDAHRIYKFGPAKIRKRSKHVKHTCQCRRIRDLSPDVTSEAARVPTPVASFEDMPTEKAYSPPTPPSSSTSSPPHRNSFSFLGPDEEVEKSEHSYAEIPRANLHCSGGGVVAERLHDTEVLPIAGITGDADGHYRDVTNLEFNTNSSIGREEECMQDDKEIQDMLRANSPKANIDAYATMAQELFLALGGPMDIIAPGVTEVTDVLSTTDGGL